MSAAETEKALKVESSSNDSIVVDPEKNATTPERQGDDSEERTDYLSGVRLGLIILGLCFAVLCVGLDNSILATAIPTITTHFNSLDDVGWYGSAFLICVCALQPISGKLYQYFSLKWTYLAYLCLFEVGSLICATAVSSVMLIVGRAVAGMGAAGLFSGALVIISHSIPLRQRPNPEDNLSPKVYTGCIASMFGVSNVVGPVLGGAFTQHLSWRWCFYINLPLGFVTALILVFLFRPSDRPTTQLPLSQKLPHLDLPGLLLFIPAVVMLLIAVQWGGSKYQWGSATVIGLIIGFAGLMGCFGYWQWRQGDEASIPFRVTGQRSVYSAVLMSFFGLGGMQLVAYYLPMYFQIVKDNTPVQSGIRFLPSVLGSFVSSILTGGLVTKYGHYNPWLFFGTAAMAISGGIFSTFKVDTGDPLINGIQVLGGLGGACVIQMPIIALMSILPENDIPIGTSISVFFQFFGGALFLAIGESIFVSRLVSALHTYAPTLDAREVVAAGAGGLRRVVAIEDPAALSNALYAYDIAITSTFYLCAAVACAAFLFAFGVEWKSVKGTQTV